MIEKIRIEKTDNVVTIYFDLSPTDILQYKDLPAIINKIFSELQNVNADVVKITGRGPVWLYSAVTHVVAHLTKCVAVYDAVNKKYVIVVSHSPNYHIGDEY
ncbi:MAG: CRISPR-associated protein Csx3 [Desulfurococcaceae archaeon]